MTTAKTWASSDYLFLFFFGGGMFNVQGAEFSASKVYSTPGVFI